MNLSERYRDQAAWARKRAEEGATPELKEQWLSLAREHERLASELGKSS